MKMMPNTTIASLVGTTSMSTDTESSRRGDSQFIESAETGETGGKRKKTVVTAVNDNPTTLQTGPQIGPTATSQFSITTPRKRERTSESGLGERVRSKKLSTSDEEQDDGNRVGDVEEHDRARQDGIQCTRGSEIYDRVSDVRARKVDGRTD